MNSSTAFTFTSTTYNQFLTEFTTVADINGDGIKDPIFFALHYDDTFTVTGEFKDLVVYLSQSDGTHKLVDTGIGLSQRFQDPYIVVDYINDDSFADIMVFDEGVFQEVNGFFNGVGNPPALFYGSASGQFSYSNELSQAVINAPKDTYIYSQDWPGGNLHIKTATAGDIDGDGDTDLWIESTGGTNITNHFMINNNGTFSVEPSRIDREAITGPGELNDPNYWRYFSSELSDVNGDGFDDLIIGQMRDNSTSNVNQTSVVVLNDGTGHFPSANQILLPLPEFREGFTRIFSSVTADFNGDGHIDIIFSHTRNDNFPDSESLGGRYLQFLSGDGTGAFVDLSANAFGDQSAASTPTPPAFTRNHPEQLEAFDINLDGHLDLIGSPVARGLGTDGDVVYLGAGDGTFQHFETSSWTKDASFFGIMPYMTDINGDGLLDLIHLDQGTGPNGSFDGGGDDTTTIYIQYGTDAAENLVAGSPVRGTTGDDSLTVSRGRTEAWGLDGNDVIVGSVHDDDLFGGNGNDLLIGGLGNDRMFGGNGFDTIRISGSSTAMSIDFVGGRVVVKNGREIDTLFEIERIQFDDKTMSFLSTEQQNEIINLYIAYFSRAPEQDGLDFHKNAVAEDLAAGTAFAVALSERAEQFFEAAIIQSDFTGYTADQTSTDFVSLLYANILARPGVGGAAPSDSDKKFWTDQIDAGTITRGAVVQRFLSDQDILLNLGTAEEKALATAAKALFDNRAAVGLEFAKPEYSAGLTNAEAFNAGRAALALVTPDPASVALATATFAASSTSSAAVASLDYVNDSAAPDAETIGIVGTVEQDGAI